MIIIRAAEASDQPGITALVRGAGINPMNLRWPNFLVAEAIGPDGRRLVGTGQLRPHERGGKRILELASLAVLPAYQRQGLGGLICECLIARAGSTPLYLMCMDKHERYYNRLGFVTVDGAQIPRVLLPYYRMGRIAARLATLALRRPHRLLIMQKQ